MCRLVGYLREEHFCQISSRSCLKRRRRSFGLFWRGRPTPIITRRRTRWVAIWDMRSVPDIKITLAYTMWPSQGLGRRWSQPASHLHSRRRHLVVDVEAVAETTPWWHSRTTSCYVLAPTPEPAVGRHGSATAAATHPDQCDHWCSSVSSTGGNSFACSSSHLVMSLSHTAKKFSGDNEKICGGKGQLLFYNFTPFLCRRY